MSALKLWTRNRPTKPKAVVFAFESRTYVWNPGLVQAVMRAHPNFNRVIARCDEIIRPLLGWSLIQEMARPPETSRYNSTEVFFEPTLVAVSIAQVEMWRERGLRPDAVVGLSAGEFTAAYTAGVLSLEETLEVACQFSQWMAAERMTLGKMMLAEVDWQRATELRDELGLEFYPVVEWKPSSTIFSGEAQAIDALVAHLDAAGIWHHSLQTKFSYHTTTGPDAGRAFAVALQGLRPQPPQVPIYSILAGGLIAEAAFDGAHWWQVATSPAYVVRTFRKLFEDGYERVLDIGFTNKVLLPIEEVAQMLGRPIEVAPSLSCLMQKRMPFTEASPMQPFAQQLDRNMTASHHD